MSIAELQEEVAMLRLIIARQGLGMVGQGLDLEMTPNDRDAALPLGVWGWVSGSQRAAEEARLQRQKQDFAAGQAEAEKLRTEHDLAVAKKIQKREEKALNEARIKQSEAE